MGRFGPSFVGRDVAARKLRYRRAMKPEYESYGPDTESILRAFSPRGQYLPLVYSRAAVEANAEATLRLTPR